MNGDDYLTAPTTEHADIVLATIPRESDPVSDTIRALSDPNNYTHALDFRHLNA